MLVAAWCRNRCGSNSTYYSVRLVQRFYLAFSIFLSEALVLYGIFLVSFIGCPLKSLWNFLFCKGIQKNVNEIGTISAIEGLLERPILSNRILDNTYLNQNSMLNPIIVVSFHQIKHRSQYLA